MDFGDISKTSPHVLAEIMRIDDAAGPAWSAADLSAMLRHQLAAAVPGTSETFGEALARGDADLLRRVKEYAKAARSDARAPLPEEIASVLYFASIAAALGRCGARISTQSDAEIRRGAEWVIQQAWVNEELRQAMRNVLKGCAT